MSLYGWVILCTILGPFALSFDRKVAFYKQFRFVLPAILTVGLVFLVWDDFFTRQEIWGFTPKYLAGIYLSKLPLEEVLFFLVVPYACVFIYACFGAYFPNWKPFTYARLFTIAFCSFGTILLFLGPENWYTLSACLSAMMLVVVVDIWFKTHWYPRFALTYTIALIPFLVVNGILTGATTPEPIVWYSENHIVGWRIITIPVEDLYYNMAMLLPVVGLYEFFSKRFRSKNLIA
jgi:lycopene cyclase domain-containing protein